MFIKLDIFLGSAFEDKGVTCVVHYEVFAGRIWDLLRGKIFGKLLSNLLAIAVLFKVKESLSYYTVYNIRKAYIIDSQQFQNLIS